MGGQLVTGAATVVGALIALVGVLTVQVRAAAADRAAQQLEVQRDALAAFLAGAEMVLDDVRELGRAHEESDRERTALVRPRYFEHWSRFIEAYARVRMHGPQELRDDAQAVHEKVGVFCEAQETYAASPPGGTAEDAAAAWDTAQREAISQVRGFRDRALAATTSTS